MKRKIFQSINALCGALVVLLAANEAMALTVKYCAKWTVEYNDDNIAEDYLKGAGSFDTPAQYAGWDVRLASTDQIIANGSGYLDSAGCTPNLTLTSGTQYKFSMLSTADRYGRTFYVLYYDAPAWNSGYSTWYILTTPTANGTVNFSYTSPGWISNMSAIAGQTVSKYADTGWPASWTVIAKNDNADGSNYSSADASNNNGRIVINTHPDELHYNEKFRVSHEIGHALGDAGNWSMHFSDYSLGVSNTNLCNCPSSSWTSGSPVYNSDSSHCMTSLELIGAAQNEGFGHFMSSMLFNNRNQNSAYFGYYKTGLAIGDRGPYRKDPPYALQVDTYEKWAENQCSAVVTNQDRGGEWDWMTFFWDLWSDNGSSSSTKRWSITEILNHWPTDTGDSETARHWDTRNAAVQNGSLSDAKKGYFEDMGAFTGVNHYVGEP